MITKIRILLITLGILSIQAAAHAQIILGTGDQFANLVIQADAFGPSPLWYEYHYNSADFSDPADPFRGADLLLAVVGDPGSGLSMSYSGNADDGTFFFSALTYNSVTLDTFLSPNNESWTYFLAGGSVNQLDEFYAPKVDGDGVPIVDAVPSGSWSLSPVGASVRYPGNGDWDAWVFGAWAFDYSSYDGALPAIAPVPEPSTIYLLGAAFLFGAMRYYQRRRSSR